MEELRIKNCVLCGLPRPLNEVACAVCGCDEYEESSDSGSDLGGWLIAANRWRDAFALYEDDVAHNRDNAGACLRLAWLASVVRDFRAVEVWAHEAQRLEPDAPGAHILLGLVLRSESRWEECLAEFDAALVRLTLGSRRHAVLTTLRGNARSQLPAWW